MMGALELGNGLRAGGSQRRLHQDVPAPDRPHFIPTDSRTRMQVKRDLAIAHMARDNHLISIEMRMANLGQ